MREPEICIHTSSVDCLGYFILTDRTIWADKIGSMNCVTLKE